VLYHAFLPAGSGSTNLTVWLAIAWRLLHSGFLGLCLFLQSKNGFWVRAFARRGRSKR
jgi:hypothetical protein